MPFVVIYDASVLYPSTLRDLLLRVAQAGLVQGRWTEEILDEMFAALRRDRPELEPAKPDRTRCPSRSGSGPPPGRGRGGAARGVG
jgi:hypothetical protein